MGIVGGCGLLQTQRTMPGWKVLGAQVGVGAEVRRSRWVVRALGGISLALGVMNRD